MFDPHRVGNIFSWRLVMKYFQQYSFPRLIQKGQLTIYGITMCTILVNRLAD